MYAFWLGLLRRARDEVSSVITVGGACCRELNHNGRQCYASGILGLRVAQVGAARRAFGSATLLPLSARTGPMALRARQGWQQLVQKQSQQLGAADRWSQLEAKLITLVNSLSLTAAGQVRGPARLAAPAAST